MFSIEMLPAVEGDALWIEYGDPNNPSRILIDCGYKSTYREIMDRLRADPKIAFELLVLTHIDGDHIAGAVPFIRDKDISSQRVKEIWFNDRRHISDALGARLGEHFAKAITDKGFPWNALFNGQAVVTPDEGVLSPISLAGGLKITLLSPGRAQLRKLLDNWTKELDDILEGRSLEEFLEKPSPSLQPDVLGEPNLKSIANRTFEPDDTAPNGSSIAFLAEYTDPFDAGRIKRALLAGDAYAPVLEASLSAVLQERHLPALKLDAFKLSHHGSKHNTSNELLKLITCENFLISTNGNRHSHPDEEAIARIIVSNKRPKDLYFNYRTR